MAESAEAWEVESVGVASVAASEAASGVESLAAWAVVQE